MRKLIYLFVLAVLVSGCAALLPNQLNSLKLGMSKEEVIKTLGPPESISASEGIEYLNYSALVVGGMGATTPHYVCIQGGKVVSFGKHGDFGTTEQPAQVIKLIGDVKTSETVNVQTNNVELEEKLRTLNRLLKGNLISKNEFEEQKKKLLDIYTGKE